MNALQSLIVLLARVLMSAIFLLAGTNQLMSWKETVAHMKAEGMQENLLPIFLAGALVAELGGGLLILLGLRPRLGALVLIAFLVPTTAIFHDFWAHGGSAQQAHMIDFMRNLAIMGGLLMIVGFGAGSWSLDHQRKRKD